VISSNENRLMAFRFFVGSTQEVKVLAWNLVERISFIEDINGME
jgi:hypothetical protein